MFCPNCGSKIEENSVFCEECGMRIQENADFKEEESVVEPVKKPGLLKRIERRYGSLRWAGFIYILYIIGIGFLVANFWVTGLCVIAVSVSFELFFMQRRKGLKGLGIFWAAVSFACAGGLLLGKYWTEKDGYINTVKYGCPNNYPDATFGEAFEMFFADPKWRYDMGDEEVGFTGRCLYGEREITVKIRFGEFSEDSFQTLSLVYDNEEQSFEEYYSLMETVYSNYDEMINEN